ncbi:carbohydrate ABC transporter permease [Halorubellus sp. JP-L1]|uniref:carbohydrate ABC transporter permease n=1 Tax=Halorubellus sp. JP-L1 TaxID=2715753 RepID=UPI0034E97D5C
MRRALTESDDEREPRTDGGVTAGGDQGRSVGPVTRIKDRFEGRFGSDFLESAPFWLPPFLLMALFVYGAILWNFFLSLTDYSGFGGADYSQLDFEMYTRAFGDPNVWNAVTNTFLLVVGFTVGTLAIGLVLAILIDRGIRFENAFRTIYLLPMSLSFVVTAQFWLWMYNYNEGIMNQFFGLFGLGPFSYLGNQSIALWAVVFALIWQFSGYAMVVYLAGLRAIPDEMYEAAKTDGASTFRMYWRIIIPQLKGATISAAVILMVFALKAFDFLYSLVSGYRPPTGTDILSTLMVRTAYSNTEWAYGAAIAIILFVLALGIIGPYLVYEFRRDNL